MIHKAFCNLGFSSFLLLAILPVANAAQSKFPSLMTSAMSKTQEHRELAEIAGCLMHIPAIVTLGSDKTNNTVLASYLAAVPTGIKVASRFVAKNDARFYEFFMWYLPIFFGYLTSLGYDLATINDPEKMQKQLRIKIASHQSLRDFKINQGVLLGLEIFLRVIAYANRVQSKFLVDSGIFDFSSCLSAGADVLELSRLLGRYVLCNDIELFTLGLRTGFKMALEHDAKNGTPYPEMVVENKNEDVSDK